MGSGWRLMVMLTVIAMVATIGRAGAHQQQEQDCIQQLLPSLTGCLEAVQSPTTKPSADCCKGVGDVVKTKMKCLCALYNSPSTVSAYGINMTRVLEIPGLCKVPADISLCKTGPKPAMAAPSPAPSKAPAPTPGGVGSQEVQDCISELLPSLTGCLDAVQSPTTKPSADCCKGVGDVVKTKMKCLCALYNSPSTVAAFGINMTRVLEIPGLCKVPADMSLCKTGGSSTPSNLTTTMAAPSPASSKPPAPTSGADKPNSGALRLTWSLKPLWALGLLWASLIMMPWA